MYKSLTTFIDNLATPQAREADVIAWSSPVPAFGNPSCSKVATLGLNPSNREFVDEHGCELEGPRRRFHTLRSLGLTAWQDVDSSHLRQIIHSCEDYFDGNPYDRWFKVLDRVVSGAGASYYSSVEPACHLDLIPYATFSKWTELTSRQRLGLLDLARRGVASLIKDTDIEILILNGRSVVAQFEVFSDCRLTAVPMEPWTLKRSGQPVAGVGYYARVDQLDGADLGRQLLVLGYNHNLQSSFGVTSVAIDAIRDWVASVSSETPRT